MINADENIDQYLINFLRQKDFGELVSAHGIIGVAAVFLRFRKAEMEEIQRRLLVVLTNHYPKKDNFFITITNNKTRLTKL